MLTKAIRLAAALGTIVAGIALVSTASAQDFFPGFWGMLGIRPPPPARMHLPFAREGNPFEPRYETRRRTTYSGGGQVYCVRTCDGRYFPLSGSEGQSGSACNSFCPAAETKVVYGSTIDDAETENGTPYSELPNAYRYRNELMVGCTCNGKDPVGLAAVRIEQDPTVRRGDIVATKDGLMIAAPERRGASPNLSPLPGKVRARLSNFPVVAGK